MDLSRYVFFAAELDVPDLLTEWKWLVPDTYTALMISKFGDWFFKSESNRLVFLDLLEASLFDLGDFSDAGLGGEQFLITYKNQLSIDWIEICLQNSMVTEVGQCYGWKLHPVLGGKFEPKNIKVFSLRVYQSLMGQMFRQLHSGMKVTGFTMRNGRERCQSSRQETGD